MTTTYIPRLLSKLKDFSLNYSTTVSYKWVTVMGCVIFYINDIKQLYTKNDSKQRPVCQLMILLSRYIQ